MMTERNADRSPGPVQSTDSVTSPCTAAHGSASIDRPSILVLAGLFPVVSKTFILYQVADLIRGGHAVSVLAESPGRERFLHPDADAGISQFISEVIPGNRAAAARAFLARALTAPGAALRLLRARLARRASPTVLRYGLSWPRRHHDLVHAHFGQNGLTAATLRALGIYRAPLVTTFHGYDANQLPGQLGADMYHPLFRAGDCFTAGSNFMAARLRSLGAPPARVVVLPWGVDLARFAFAERHLDRGAALRVVSVGRLVPVKGVEFGLRAVAAAIRSGARVTYTVVGNGPLEASLKALAGELGIADAVTFAGALDQDAVRRVLAAGHVFLLPGIVADNGEVEGQGLVLAEAQATGMPVIATRVGGMPEGLVDGATGLLAESRDVSGLAAHIAYFHDQPNRLAAMGRAGRSLVARDFNRERVLERLQALYADVRQEWLESAAVRR